MNSLGLNFDGEKGGGRLAVRLIAGTNRACGTFVTPYIPGKFRPTPIKNDGTRYTWTLIYDPEANQGNGRFEFTIKSNAAQPEPFEGRVFSVDLPAGFQKEGTTFDHFGLMNMMKSGDATTIHFDDLQYDGRSQDFAQDPVWDASGNRVTFQDQESTALTTSVSARSTSYAGGAAGEVGGAFWRSGKYGYYADRVGPLTLDDRAGGQRQRWC